MTKLTAYSTYILNHGWQLTSTKRAVKAAIEMQEYPTFTLWWQKKCPSKSFALARVSYNRVSGSASGLLGRVGEHEYGQLMALAREDKQTHMH